MSRFQVEILPEAEAEIREAFLWYLERSPLAADAFRTEALAKIEGLHDDADSWPKDDEEIHFRILSRFPYTVHYDLVGVYVTVLAVSHHRRKPGYWHQRGDPTPGTSGTSRST